ncbi:MAG: phosphate acyltransferase [Nitrospinae bacterium CG11_big_fil_rev_8_21_14_0_20_45_15]|nr:MAG: phosphate acyltransferase [Nitrospinae bacterium CG11_big_fil_rev_8_21_14_0_20_45_15]
MKIAVDAMGGDHAPSAIVEGAVLAARQGGVEVILVGVEAKIQEELRKFDVAQLPIRIEHADQIVDMHDAPGKVLRSKRKSSIKVGLDLVKEGMADAFVSAGNTGAVLAFSTLILRPLKGVDRPAITVQLPTLQGSSLLLDAGANVDCKAIQLFQFGVMGHAFAKYILGKENPRVGILSIGEEDGKGNEITKEVFHMLKKSHVNFIGNVEGKEVYRGNADVVVCDGFTGNVALKISESLAEMIGKNLKEMFSRNWKSKLGYFLLKSQLAEFKKKVDHSETGGAPLLGVNGVCIIAHGSSSPKAIKNAIKRANELAEKKINEHIRDDIESNLADLDMGLWKQIKSAFVPEILEDGKKNNSEKAVDGNHVDSDEKPSISDKGKDA